MHFVLLPNFTLRLVQRILTNACQIGLFHFHFRRKQNSASSPGARVECPCYNPIFDTAYADPRSNSTVIGKIFGSGFTPIKKISKTSVA